MSEPFLMVYVTTADHSEAMTIATLAVEAKLAACANILGSFDSIYWWQDKIEKSREVNLILKTSKELYPELEILIKRNHSYETPCIVALPITIGHAPFFDWLAQSLKETQ